MTDQAGRSLRHRPVVVHLTTTDMSLDWLLGPQLASFVEAGYDVVGVSAPGPHVANLGPLGVRHESISSLTRSTSVTRDVKAFVDLVRLFWRIDPDIVHTHNPKPGILGRLAARVAGVPWIVNTQHGLYAQPEDRRRRRWPVYAAERVAAMCSDVELVQNEEDVQTLVRRLRVPAGRVRLLGNGVDLTRFDPSAVPASARERLRGEWEIGPDELVCGCVGRLVREKGIVELLAAAKKLRSASVPVRLVVIGPTDPDKSDAIDADLISQAVANGVVFTGQRNDMPECYAAMDMFVTASWREGFPRSAMEAAAMQLPTVATDIRGNRQVITDERTGLLVPVRDPAAIATAITRLVGHLDLVDRFGRAAFDKSRAEFGQDRVVSRTLNAYGDCPSGRRFGRRRAPTKLAASG